MQGVPWEPIPGKEGVEIKSKITFKEDGDKIPEVVEGKEEDKKRRRFRVEKEDVMKNGGTEGCEACSRIMRGARGGNHIERCRKRFEEMFKENEDKRLERQDERLEDQIEEEQDKLEGADESKKRKLEGYRRERGAERAAGSRQAV